MIRNCQIVFFILLLAQISNAQKSLVSAVSYPKSRHFMLVMEAQHLRSSHSQTIYGGSVMLGYRVSHSVSAGIGCEISHIDSLFTHDQYTTVLKFTPLPIYVEARFNLIQNSKVTPYLNLAAGMSSITYERKRFDMSGGNMESRERPSKWSLLQGRFWAAVQYQQIHIPVSECKF